ncbi:MULTISPECIES: type IV secretory system conjugative DNA transfer family protein [Bacillus]|uniref:type IV secretory system conjugative DNA transfer family protein n=1 Tax=Bacillus TaxID=1386 RepID=UPI001572560F|nr:MULTISPECIES: type IV secretory system conjugative DNA transfer family protein [Bacillus]MBC6975110.1 ATP-binding protein [Bacillus sp. Xin]MBY0600380.1 DUF87 domain-containing protein [Bacillus bingmayongensis]NSW38439.1 ATP-binding protein [Bacillus sp. Xin1]
MNGTFIGRSAQPPVFLKPKWYDMSKQNSFVMGSKGISHQFVFAGDNRNILVRGGTGTGKTRLMKQLLKMVAEANQKAVVLDGYDEYFEHKKEFQIISLAEKPFLNQTEQERCKQSDVVIIDEGLKWYFQDPEKFLVFLDELEQADTRVFASFQAIPEALVEKFDVYLELDPLIA